MSFTSNSSMALLPTTYPPGTIIAKPDYLFKVLMIGESGTGKSALLARFVDGTFEPNFISTIGVDFKIHYMKTETGKNVKVQVWDTAGQERFRTITTSYYRGANGVLIVFDVTDEVSFEKVRYWLNELKEHSTPGIPFLLVANKIDKRSERVVDFEAAKRFAAQVGIDVVEASAKTSEGVNEVFGTIAALMIKKKTQDAAAASASASAAASSSGGSGSNSNGFGGNGGDSKVVLNDGGGNSGKNGCSC